MNIPTKPVWFLPYGRCNKCLAGYLQRFFFKLAVFSDNNSAFGPPTLDYTGDSATDKAFTCANLISTDLDNSHMIATKADMLDNNVMITDAPDLVQFNNMGCTIDVLGNACSTDVRIEIQGKNSLAVCSKSQGYIHVCGKT